MRRVVWRWVVAFLAVLTWTGVDRARAWASPHHSTEESGRRRGPRNVALLIGISDYEYFTQDGPPGSSDLEGPRNDVPRIKRSLERWGFIGDDNVRVLQDAQASRAGILSAFEWLVRTATDRDDAVVIYWSGHGSYAPDRDGDESEVNPRDKDDEALVPWDARDIHDPGQLLLDDDIRRFLSRLKTANVTVIVDACFSGTATRGASARVRGPMRPTGSAEGGSGLDPLANPTNHVLLTASSADQLSLEVRFGPDSTTAFGIFTYFLTQAMDLADADARVDELWQDVSQRVRTYPGWKGQLPQLEGARSSRLFHVNGDVARLPFVAVESRAGNVLVGAGAIHGVRAGAEYEVFAPGDAEFTGSPLGRVVVDSVRSLDAIAHSDTGGPFPPGARAVLARVPAGATALRQLDVFVDSSAIPLDSALRKYSWLHITSSRTAPVEISRIGKVVRVLHRGLELVPVDSDQVVQAGTIIDNIKSVVSGFRASTPLCEPLRRAFIAEALNEIHNPAAPRGLKAGVRLVPAGTRPTERESSIADTAWIGEKFDLYARVDAPATSRLYLTIALEGITTTAKMLYPASNNANSLFPLNKWVLVRSALSASEPLGTDVLKAVVSPHQYDFDALLRSIPTCQRAATTKFNEKADPAGEWTDAETRVVFARRPKQ